jgi:hypothetical protein
MTSHPYADTEWLANLVWEAEMVADAFAGGGLILIKTKEGWRAFLGGFSDEALRKIEETLDKNVPSPERAHGLFVGRSPTLIDEIQDLLTGCNSFVGYRPMKLMDARGK